MTITLKTSPESTPELDFSAATVGSVCVCSANTMKLFTFYAAPEAGGTYLPLRDSHGNAVTLRVAANGAYRLPAALFGCRFVKIVADVAGTVHISLQGY